MHPTTTIKPTHCWLQLKTPLADNTLLLWQIEGQESFSELFRYRLTLLAATSSILPEQLIGKAMTVAFKDRESDLRYIQGYVNHWTVSADQIEGFNVYHAELVPWLWFLTQTQQSRIFQNKTCLAIIKEVLAAYQFNYDSSAVQDYYPTLEYCVQYQESDFVFLARLMEQAGIFYYFQHNQNGHVLILANQKTGYNKSEPKVVKVNSGAEGLPHLEQWQHSYQFCPSSWQVASHDFNKPEQILKANEQSQLNLANAKQCSYYEYVAEYQQQLQISQLPKQRLAERESQYSLVQAQSSYASLAVGDRLQLAAGELPAETTRQYVITSLSLYAVENSYLSNKQKILPAYHNSFTALPATIVFSPRRQTLKPRPKGVQEAFITGPQSESIYADKLGRMKVRFTWNLNGKTDETSSCWLRMLRSWEGLLRVGTPVLVDFIEGDIDRPYILGPIDNAKQLPLYDPQKYKTQSGLKRRPGTQENDKTYNELCFEDKPGEEKLSLHAGKDMELAVANDYQATIKHDETRTVQHQRLTTIKEGDDTLIIDQGKLVITVKNGDYIIKVNGNITLDAGGDMTLKAGGSLNLQASKAVQLKSGTNFSINSGTSLALKSGTALSQEAGTSLTQTASVKASLKGALADINSDGLMQIKGTLVKVN